VGPGNVSQDQAIVLCLKIVEVSGLVTITAFITCYSRWASWIHNAIGRTIVIKDLLLVVAFIPSLLSLFLNFNRLTSHIAAWIDISMLGLISPVMIWRIFVFRSIHRSGQREDGSNDGA
jgi:hypothetical protein